MDILARAQPIVDTARQQIPNLQEALSKIIEAIRNVWSQVTETGFLNSFMSRISGLLSGAASQITATANSAVSTAEEAVTPGEQAPLIAPTNV